MARQVLILGTVVTLPDPGTVTPLALSFRNVSGRLTELQDMLQALSRPEAWGDWTGNAADAFGRSIGQLPSEMGEVAEAYGAVAAALQEYASELEPTINALTALSFQADDAESALGVTRSARDQVAAQGLDPVTTGWDARLADAAAVVDGLRDQLTRQLADLDAMATRCAKRITAAEPHKAGKSLLGSLSSDFMTDVADPLGRAAAAAARAAEAAARAYAATNDAINRGVDSAVEALFIRPLTELPGAVAAYVRDPSAENLAKALGDTTTALGILAMIPGVDVVAVPVLLGVTAVAAGAEWVAASHHEAGASYLDAGLATVSLGLGGVGYVAGRAVDADSALLRQAYDAHDLPGLRALADGTDARVSGSALWKAGLPRPFTRSDVQAVAEDPYDAAGQVLASADGASAGISSKLGDMARGVASNVRSQASEFVNLGSDEFTHSPAAVTIEHQKWLAERAENFVDISRDQLSHPDPPEIQIA